MKKFSITVHRVDEYEIEIDEDIYDDQTLEAWSSNFHEVFNLQDLAESLARRIMLFGSDVSFIEGFGFVKASTKSREVIPRYEVGHREISEGEYTKGISVKILIENENYECEIEEID